MPLSSKKFTKISTFSSAQPRRHIRVDTVTIRCSRRRLHADGLEWKVPFVASTRHADVKDILSANHLDLTHQSVGQGARASVVPCCGTILVVVIVGAPVCMLSTSLPSLYYIAIGRYVEVIHHMKVSSSSLFRGHLLARSSIGLCMNRLF